MSDGRTPAWKRAGLTQKAKPAEVYNPIATGNKRVSDDGPGTGTSKTAPKRPKIPKSERGPPPEPDQLAYLRCYHENRDKWKFSKQKQNWIIRQVWEIPDEYSEALLVYLEGLQGASRPRLVEASSEIISRWNSIMTEDSDSESDNESGKEEDTNSDRGEQKSDDKEDTKEEKEEKDANDETKESKEDKEQKPLTQKMAERAQLIVEKLTGSRPELASAE